VATEASSGQQFPPEAFTEIICHPSLPLTVGGQAVNIWATHYKTRDPSLLDFAPFLSHDCDVVADSNSLADLGNATRGWTLHLVEPGAASPVVGHLVRKSDLDDLLVEELYAIHGLSQTDLEDWSELVRDHSVVRLLGPLTLLKSKIANLNNFPQGDRQDERHVRTMIRCVRCFIQDYSDLVDRGEKNEREMVRMLERLLAIVTSQRAQGAARKYGIHFRQCFPESLESSPFEKVRRFATVRLCFAADKIGAPSSG
jgi:hypothetical protein